MSSEKIIDEALFLKEFNEILLDRNYNLLLRLIHLYQENNLTIDPETMALVSEVRKTLGMKRSLSPNHKQPFKIPEGSTEPKIDVN
jgi:hypothetical protein